MCSFCTHCYASAPPHLRTLFRRSVNHAECQRGGLGGVPPEAERNFELWHPFEAISSNLIVKSMSCNCKDFVECAGKDSGSGNLPNSNERFSLHQFSLRGSVSQRTALKNFFIRALLEKCYTSYCRY